MDWILWSICLIGHTGFWCVIFNRIHATAYPRKIRKASEKIALLAVGLPILWVATIMVLEGGRSFQSFTVFTVTWLYLYASVLLGCYFVARWCWRKFVFGLPKSVVFKSREWFSIGDQIEGPFFLDSFSRLLGRVPFNEASKLVIERMSFQLPLPKSFHGLRICHLSDLHFTGQITVEYFQRLIEHANAFEPDLVFITGDLVDVPECVDWLDETVGRLKSRLGCYYVLGNHDLRINDEKRLREKLADLGLVQVSGRWVEVLDGDKWIHLTGNELPWFDDANQLSESPEHEADLKILLSHSPDQIDWARQFDFHLMFAGHTHGGQIALPFFGPIVAPSKYGVLYASGTFQIGNMLMHVSRGISGDEPIRICSPPELGLFTLVDQTNA